VEDEGGAHGRQEGLSGLVAWQKADELTSAVYRASTQLPPSAGWLKDQILRCALSVPSNIAEGHGRGSRLELLRFLDIARGSLSELEYLLHFLRKEALLPVPLVGELEKKRIETGRVVFGLWRSLKAMRAAEWDHTGKIGEENEIYQLAE
jgi:four helix bundle protein